MSRFFIDRPIFAWVIAIVIMLARGPGDPVTLPIAQYPSIAPAARSRSPPPIRAPTASDAGEHSVTQVIEQQMKGLDHLRVPVVDQRQLERRGDDHRSPSQQGTNPDIAQVQVQNKLQLATPLLPTQVQQQGLVVAKATKNFLLIIGVYSQDGSHNNADLGDYIVSASCRTR